MLGNFDVFSDGFQNVTVVPGRAVKLRVEIITFELMKAKKVSMKSSGIF